MNFELSRSIKGKNELIKIANLSKANGGKTFTSNSILNKD